jgi:uncharacterized membrane protein YczE
MKQTHFIRRVIQFLLGINILALGGAFSIVAGQGTTPVNVLPYLLSQIFSTNIRFWMMLVMGIYLLIQGLLLKKFSWINVAQLIAGLLFGTFVDLYLLLIGSQAPFGTFGVLLYVVLSILCVALGITLYVDANVLQMPTEGVLHALATRYPKRWPFYRGKIMADSVSVLLSVILSILFLREIRGVGIGTLVSAFMIGPIVKVFQELIARLRRKIS